MIFTTEEAIVPKLGLFTNDFALDSLGQAIP